MILYILRRLGPGGERPQLHVLFEPRGVDRLIDQVVAAPSDKAASTLYERAARIIVDDSPDIFIGQRLEVTVMRKEVQGYYVMPANFRGLRLYERSKQ